MVLRCTHDHCGGRLLLEFVDDSAFCAPTAPTREYVCSLCARSATPTVATLSATEYQLAQARSNSFDRAIAGLARKAAS